MRVFGAISNYCLYVVVKTFKIFSFVARGFVKLSALLSLFLFRFLSRSFSLSFKDRFRDHHFLWCAKPFKISKLRRQQTHDSLFDLKYYILSFSQIFSVILYKRGDPKILSPRCTIELYA